MVGKCFEKKTDNFGFETTFVRLEHPVQPPPTETHRAQSGSHGEGHNGVLQREGNGKMRNVRLWWVNRKNVQKNLAILLGRFCWGGVGVCD